MPNELEECMVAFRILPEKKECGLAYSLAIYVDGEFISWEKQSTLNCITHWMSLPEGPEDE